MNSEFTPEDIKKFLLNELEEEKTEKIAAFLKTMSSQQLDTYMPDQVFYETDPIEVPGPIQIRMRKAVKKEVRGNTGDWRKPLFLAACFIGLIMGGYYLVTLTNHPTGGDLTAYTLTNMQVSNKTGKDKYIHLPDGSGVLLKPAASIRYLSNFIENRFVYMDGNARFDVKHDARHPLTVVASGIGTLDIGTSFWIYNNKNKAEVTVQLLEGSIAVKSLENSFPAKNIYLQPGEQIRIRKQVGDYFVSRMQQIDPQTQVDPLPTNAKNRLAVTNWTNAAYSFSKSPLQKVFEQLSARYHVTILADPVLIQNREFTGKIMYTDSLNILLNAICNLNHLSYTTNGKKIQITEKK